MHIARPHRSALMATAILALFSPAVVGPLSAHGVADSGEARLPIVIERQGSFAAGGKVIGERGKTLHCDQGYVGFQIPVRARKISLFMWHSSSAHVWEQRWDGGEGFQSLFLRRGYPVYIWDGPRVGRGNMSCEAYSFEPVIGQDQRNWVSWRLGPTAGEWFANVQFPKDDPDAYDQAMAARYDEFDDASNAHLEGEAGAKAIDRIGAVVLLTNSAGDWRAMLATLPSRTGNVKAIVAYEPAAFVFPEGEGPSGPETGFGPTHVPLAEFMKLTHVPIQLVWGDNTQGTFWEKDVQLSRQFADTVNRLGGHAELLMLPSVGLRGNTHIAFADLNNVEVADQLSLFLHKHKLDQR